LKEIDVLKKKVYDAMEEKLRAYGATWIKDNAEKVVVP
jgi:hypothetical protein